MRPRVVALAVGVALAPLDAWPCRGPFPTLPEAVGRAAVVLVGRVESVREADAVSGLPRSKVLVAQVKVERVLKGAAAGTVEIRGDTTTCGWRPQPGARMLLFAGGSPLASSALEPNRALKTDLDRDRAVSDVLAALGPADTGGDPRP